jgi:prephenate dehydrogenase
MGDAVVGIIGMGDMGKMYARRISDAGWTYVNFYPEGIAAS